MNLFYVLALGTAVSIDSFAAGMAYGVKQIQLPVASLLIIGTVTALCTANAMLLAHWLGAAIDTRLAVILGALLLMVLGVISCGREYLLQCSKTGKSSKCIQLMWTAWQLLISIMAHPERADLDCSQLISSSEALLLGLALGIDNMAATFAAALLQPLPLYTPLVMGLIQALLLTAGTAFVHTLAPGKLKQHFPYLPGLILIALGLLRFL